VAGGIVGEIFERYLSVVKPVKPEPRRVRMVALPVALSILS